MKPVHESRTSPAESRDDSPEFHPLAPWPVRQRPVSPEWAHASAILATLPPEDPHDIIRRRAVLTGHDRYPAGVPLTRWRTRAEAAWSDPELRKAWALHNAGDRSQAVTEAAQAYRRIIARRDRAQRLAAP